MVTLITWEHENSHPEARELNNALIDSGLIIMI
ncbi:hypothetical protein H1N91_gp05 [Escherichia phage grams]|uniref:Uncharacterized protein n=1 Tax=Escherichia phage grams TaxID=2696401 RepID=A0A6B9WKF0_9CAUD|nr:hypothetical protein H1N91_gp05 [Escherichia phage grams]QHR65196.1 hypothetical protein grams_5 [Escherichia phage grams]